MKISNLPEIRYVTLDKLNDSNECLVITSPTAWETVKSKIKLNIKAVIYPESTKEEYLKKLKEEIEKNFGNVKIIYGIGGGQAIDTAKYIAFHRQIPVVAIPTLLSTDAFLADYIALRVDNCVTYPEVKRPDIVYLDYKFLSNLPQHYISVGCGDTLAILTALADWKYAREKHKTTTEDKFSQQNYDFANSIVAFLLANKKEIENKTLIGMQSIVQALSMKVQLCSFLGHSRPEEGSEHFFVYNLENYTKHFLHGDAVALGVLIMLKLHKKDIKDIKEFCDSVKLEYKQFSNEEIKMTLQSLPKFCEKNDLAFSIANDLNLNENEITSIIKEIYQ